MPKSLEGKNRKSIIPNPADTARWPPERAELSPDNRKYTGQKRLQSHINALSVQYTYHGPGGRSTSEVDDACTFRQRHVEVRVVHGHLEDVVLQMKSKAICEEGVDKTSVKHEPSLVFADRQCRWACRAQTDGERRDKFGYDWAYSIGYSSVGSPARPSSL